MSAKIHRGSASMRDYTPGSAVNAGDVISIGGVLYVAHLDIAAGELGALACPAGMTAYRVDLESSHSITDGEAVNVDPATGTTSSAGGIHFGYAEGAADEGAGDTFVVLRHTGPAI